MSLKMNKTTHRCRLCGREIAGPLDVCMLCALNASDKMQIKEIMEEL